MLNFKKSSFILFLSFGSLSAIAANDDIEFFVKNYDFSCTQSIFGGVDKCQQSFSAFAYQLPRRDGAIAKFTCYVYWTYTLVSDKKQVTRNYVISETATINAGSAKDNLQLNDTLNTTKQATKPEVQYNCEVKY